MQYRTRNVGEAEEFKRHHMLPKLNYVQIQTVFTVFLSLVMLSCGWGQAEESLPFDAQTWKDATLIKKQDTVRRPMARDLVQKGLLLNKTRDEVIQLLGQPQSISPFSQPEEEVLVYSLGQIYSGEIYYHRVVLKNEVVIDAHIANTL